MGNNAPDYENNLFFTPKEGLSKEDLIHNLRQIEECPEGEMEDHVLADRLLLDYINDAEVTDAFNSINKWYA